MLNAYITENYFEKECKFEEIFKLCELKCAYSDQVITEGEYNHLATSREIPDHEKIRFINEQKPYIKSYVMNMTLEEKFTKEFYKKIKK